jgi:hypothetical protein
VTKRLDRLTELDTEIRALERRIHGMVVDSGTTLTEIHGVGALVAARIIGEVGAYADLHPKPSSPRPTAAHPFPPHRAEHNAIASTAAATDDSTEPSTSSPSPRPEPTTPAATTTNANNTKEKPAEALRCLNGGPSPPVTANWNRCSRALSLSTQTLPSSSTRRPTRSG